MAVQTKHRKAVDESGNPETILESKVISSRTDLDGNPEKITGLSAFFAEDGEQLTRDGEWFRGIHSQRRFKLLE